MIGAATSPQDRKGWGRIIVRPAADCQGRPRRVPGPAGVCYPRIFFTAAMIFSSLTVTYFSSLGAKGIGVCMDVTR